MGKLNSSRDKFRFDPNASIMGSKNESFSLSSKMLAGGSPSAAMTGIYEQQEDMLGRSIPYQQKFQHKYDGSLVKY